MTKAEFISRFRKTPANNPEATLLATFFVVALLGTVLLALPLALRPGAAPLSLVDAAFTAMSAVCVTGLCVVDVASRFSLFGQAVILVLIELGGLGIITFATFFAVLAGRDLNAKSESLINSTIGGDESRNLKSLLKSTVGLVVSFECVAAAILAYVQHSRGVDWIHAVWHGVFHSVSSFCNAGFSLTPDSLIGYRSDVPVMLVTCVLVIVGSLGFMVVCDLIGFKSNSAAMKRRRISLHTSLVLQTALALVVFGTLAFLAFEWNHSLAGLGRGEKIVVAAFQSIASRTCGFTTVDMAETSSPTRFLTELQMFIGGAPGSTAGGIKTTTFAVLLLTMVSTVRRRPETIYRARAIPEKVVRGAVAVFLISIFTVCATAGMLLVTENPLPENVEKLFFDAVSACSTTGLSLGAVTGFSTAGKIVTIVAMYIGRVGPLTAAFLIGRSGSSRAQVKYPEEDVIVG